MWIFWRGCVWRDIIAQNVLQTELSFITELFYLFIKARGIYMYNPDDFELKFGALFSLI